VVPHSTVSCLYISSAAYSKHSVLYCIPDHATVQKSKGFPYSFSCVGPGADPGVQAVSQGEAVITFCQACGYLPSRTTSPPLGRYQVILLDDTVLVASYPVWYQLLLYLASYASGCCSICPHFHVPYQLNPSTLVLLWTVTETATVWMPF